MTNSKRIFVDTSAWIAFLLKDETHHSKVHAYFDKETKARSEFFTSDYVLDETYTRLLTNQSIYSAKKFKEKINDAKQLKRLTLLWTDKTVCDKAWEYFMKFSDHKLSFTDATIYTFVKNFKIDEVLTLDKGFKKVGLVTKPMI